MQLPGPTLIVTEGQTVTVTLRNNLPAAAGNTSIVFPGFQVTATGGVQGRLAQEAAGGGTVTYTFTASTPGTHAYYSGTQADLQIEMGLFGAIIVLPSTPPAGCTKGQYSLASAAYDNAATCYDREYMFQLSELDSRIHDQALAQVQACPTGPCPQIVAVTEPYHPNYYLVNGRSMPDDMDTSYAPGYLHQPYNANPHMHPGEKLLMRIIGQGRWQHPFHFHGNHARVLARDGNLLVSASDGTTLAGPLLFTTPTVSGQTQDQIFTWTGKGLNWDVYNHTASSAFCKGGPNNFASCTPATAATVCGAGVTCAPITCTPDANGYHSVGHGPELRRVVRRPREAHPGHAAGPEHRRHRPVVRRHALPRHPVDRCLHQHQRAARHAQPEPRGRLRVHVALAQRARDHDERRVPGRNDVDAAHRPSVLVHRRNPLTRTAGHRGEPRASQSPW